MDSSRYARCRINPCSHLLTTVLKCFSYRSLAFVVNTDRLSFLSFGGGNFSVIFHICFFGGWSEIM